MPAAKYREEVVYVVGMRDENVVGIAWHKGWAWASWLAGFRKRRGTPHYFRSLAALREGMARSGATTIVQLFAVLSDHDAPTLFEDPATQKAEQPPLPDDAVLFSVTAAAEFPPAVPLEARRIVNHAWKHRLGDRTTWSKFINEVVK